MNDMLRKHGVEIYLGLGISAILAAVVLTGMALVADQTPRWTAIMLVAVGFALFIAGLQAGDVREATLERERLPRT